MLTLLIADDEYFILERLKQMTDYTALGYELVGMASNGREAMQNIETLRPDLAIIDIKMPFLSGLDIAQQVREQGLPTKIILLTSYDYFDFAQQAIRFQVLSYLLKPIKEKELTRALTEARARLEAEKADERLRDQFAKLREEQALYAFLTRETPPDLPEGLLSSPALREVKLLLFGKVDNPEAQPDLIRASKADFCGGPPVLFWLPCSDNTLCLLLSAVEEPDRVASQTRSLLAKRFQAPVNVIYSETDCIAALPATFTLVQNAMAESAFGAGNLAASVSQFPCRTVPHRHFNIRDALLVLMRAGDGSGARALLDRTFDLLCREAPSVYNLELLLSEVLTACAIHRENEDSAPENGLSVSIHELLSNHLLCGAIRNWCIQYTENRLHANSNSESGLAASVAELINASYSDPGLSLPYISQKVGYAANYLSTVFKKNTGISVVQYITQRRMLEAKRLLTERSMQVNQVCQRVGYSNPFYFSRRFKQFYGFAPSECGNR